MMGRDKHGKLTTSIKHGGGSVVAWAVELGQYCLLMM